MKKWGQRGSFDTLQSALCPAELSVCMGTLHTAIHWFHADTRLPDHYQTLHTVWAIYICTDGLSQEHLSCSRPLRIRAAMDCSELELLRTAQLLSCSKPLRFRAVWSSSKSELSGAAQTLSCPEQLRVMSQPCGERIYLRTHSGIGTVSYKLGKIQIGIDRRSLVWQLEDSDPVSEDSDPVIGVLW